MKFYKYFLAAIMLFVWVQSAKAQKVEFFVSAGYNVNYSQFDSLNYLINRYNFFRPALAKQMRELHIPHGWTFETGVYWRFLLIQAGYTFRKQQVSSLTLDTLSDQVYQQDLVMRLNTLNAGIGFRFRLGRLIQLAPGANFDAGNLFVGFRENNPDDISNESFDPVKKAFNSFTSVFLKMMYGNNRRSGLKIVIEPYYNIGFKKNDVSSVDEALLNEAPGSSQRIHFKPSQLGLKAMLSIYICSKAKD